MPRQRAEGARSAPSTTPLPGFGNSRKRRSARRGIPQRNGSGRRNYASAGEGPKGAQTETRRRRLRDAERSRANEAEIRRLRQDLEQRGPDLTTGRAERALNTSCLSILGPCAAEELKTWFRATVVHRPGSVTVMWCQVAQIAHGPIKLVILSRDPGTTSPLTTAYEQSSSCPCQRRLLPAKAFCSRPRRTVPDLRVLPSYHGKGIHSICVPEAFFLPGREHRGPKARSVVDLGRRFLISTPPPSARGVISSSSLGFVDATCPTSVRDSAARRPSVVVCSCFLFATSRPRRATKPPPPPPQRETVRPPWLPRGI